MLPDSAKACPTVPTGVSTGMAVALVKTVPTRQDEREGGGGLWGQKFPNLAAMIPPFVGALALKIGATPSSGIIGT